MSQTRNGGLNCVAPICNRRVMVRRTVTLRIQVCAAVCGGVLVLRAQLRPRFRGAD